MLKHIFIISFIVLTHSAFYPATSPVFTYSGRRYIQNDTVRYDWPCFRIAFCFLSSNKVVLHIKDTWNIYNAIIDNETIEKVQPKKDTAVIIFESSSWESHCVEIFKITENHYGPLGSHIDSSFEGI